MHPKRLPPNSDVLYLIVILHADTAGAFRFCSNKSCFGSISTGRYSVVGYCQQADEDVFDSIITGRCSIVGYWRQGYEGCI